MKPLRVINLSLAAALLILSFVEASQGQTKKSGPSESYLQDSQRQQALRLSGKQWFERNVLPYFRGAMSSVTGYGVTITEPRVILPPNLGGPLKMIEVVLEAKVTGWNTGFYYHRYRDRFSSFPAPGSTDCRYKQKLWAQIDGRGKPVKIIESQKANAMIACFSGGHIVPGYHGDDERYEPNF